MWYLFCGVRLSTNSKVNEFKFQIDLGNGSCKNQEIKNPQNTSFPQSAKLIIMNTNVYIKNMNWLGFPFFFLIVFIRNVSQTMTALDLSWNISCHWVLENFSLNFQYYHNIKVMKDKNNTILSSKCRFIFNVIWKSFILNI